MAKCCICGKAVDERTAAMLFYSEKKGQDMQVCGECEKQLNTITESSDKAELRKAAGYISAYAEKAADAETRQYLVDMLESNAIEIGKPAHGKQDDLARATFWTAGLRVFAWLAGFGMIILGIVIGGAIREVNGGLGTAIIICGFVLAFVSIAGLMVFIEMAEDIREMRNSMTKRK